MNTQDQITDIATELVEKDLEILRLANTLSIDDLKEFMPRIEQSMKETERLLAEIKSI